jgi:hypothetical protein
MATRQRKIKGSFCEKKAAPARDFDRRSFRYKKSGKAWLLIGCLGKGNWDPKGYVTVGGKRRYGRCRVGTRLVKILVPVGRRARCPAGAKRVKKG